MKPAKLWPLALVAVLASTVVANVAILVQAGGDGRAIAEPDYYRKAVAWDSTMAQERRNAELGWNVDLDLEGGPGDATVRMRLTDAAGRPLPGAEVWIEAIHNRDASHPVRSALVTGPDGEARARAALRLRGLWELRLEATRGGDRFTARLRRDLSGGAP